MKSFEKIKKKIDIKMSGGDCEQEHGSAVKIPIVIKTVFRLPDDQ